MRAIVENHMSMIGTYTYVCMYVPKCRKTGASIMWITTYFKQLKLNLCTYVFSLKVNITTYTYCVALRCNKFLI